MDTAVLFIAGSSFFVFFVMQCVFFRMLSSERFMKVFLYSFFIGLLTCISITFLFQHLYQNSVVLVFGFVLYCLASMTYVLCIYAIIDSSLHLRLVLEIAKSGEKGITKHELTTVYNESRILDKRLRWLLADKVIVKKKNIYIKTNLIRSIHIREVCIEWFERLFP